MGGRSGLGPKWAGPSSSSIVGAGGAGRRVAAPVPGAPVIAAPGLLSECTRRGGEEERRASSATPCGWEGEEMEKADAHSHCYFFTHAHAVSSNVNKKSGLVAN
jgi:hypothetical protein